MKMNLNRGAVIFASIVAGLLIGLFAGAYIYYAWIPSELILRDAPPRVLAHDYVSQTPQYRDIYVVRVANAYQGDTRLNDPNALLNAYQMLGVTVGDATLDQAIAMVREAADVALVENQKDGDLGRFSKNDELALKTLTDGMQAAKDAGKGPVVDPSLSAPARDRNTSRLVGFIILLLLALGLGTVVYLVDHRAGSVRGVTTNVNTTVTVQPNARVQSEPAIPPALNAATNTSPTAPGTTATVRVVPAQRTAQTASQEKPIVTFAPTTYRYGDDHYDEDFAINGNMDELIGECGASIADRLGLDTPARVSALALWVFDKNDFQSTTKVLMTDFAYNDSVVKAKLKSRGDAVLATDNGVVEIMTSTLRVEVLVSDLQYNADNNPPHGYFQNVTLTYQVYKRQPEV
jgi:hypothetical protein